MKNMNIIICDDRIDDRKNLSDLLSDYGEKKNYEFAITEYDSGEQLCEEKLCRIFQPVQLWKICAAARFGLYTAFLVSFGQTAASDLLFMDEQLYPFWIFCASASAFLDFFCRWYAAVAFFTAGGDKWHPAVFVLPASAVDSVYTCFSGRASAVF